MRLLGLVIDAFQWSQLAPVATARTREPPVDPRRGGRPTAGGRLVAAVEISRRAPVGGAAIAAVGTSCSAPVAGAGGGVAAAGGGLGASSTAGVRGQGGVAEVGGDALAGEARSTLPGGAGHGGGTPPSVDGALAGAADTAVQRGEAGGGGNLTGVSAGAIAAPHLEMEGPPAPLRPRPQTWEPWQGRILSPSPRWGSVGADAAFGGALGSKPACVRVRGATQAGEFRSRPFQATPRLDGGDASWRGDTLAFPLGGVCQSGGANISAGRAAGAQPDTLELPPAPQGGVNTGADGAADGRVGSAVGPAHAVDAITPAGAPTFAAPGVRVKPIDGSSPASVPRSTLEATYTPPVVTGLPADPAPAEPNVWAEPPAAASSRPRRGRAAAPRPVRGVRDGAAAHLQDMSEIAKLEWEAMDTAIISHCWVKARILPPAMEASVTAMHGSYRHSLRNVAQNVDQVLSDVRGCYLGVRCFGDAGQVERHHAVEAWLGLESDPEVIIDTADAELWRESGDETDKANADEPDGDGDEE